MYSKAFERSYSISDKTSTDCNWNAREPVVLAKLSALNREIGSNHGNFSPNRQKTNDFKDLQMEVYRSFDEVKDLWLQFENNAACFIYQRFSFCRTWYETVGKKDGVRLHMVVVRDVTGEILMLAPLCLKKGRFGTVVSFIGDGMADYLAPLVQDDFAASLSTAGFEVVWKDILATIECKIDLVWLDRQPVSIIGVKNPMTHLAHFNCTSSTHALNFPQAENWSQCARLLRSNKTANNIERRLRKLAKKGDVELIEVTDPAKRQEHMSQLLALKITNLNDAGTLHRMDTPDVARFYHALVADDGMQKNTHQFELRCGGKLVASVFGFVHHDTFYYQVCGFERQEFGQHSPGLLLLYQLFDWSHSRKLKRFDMTIGDEFYKKDWSNDTTQLVTVAVPHSNLGRLEYAGRRLLLWTKEKIKNTSFLRKLALVLLK